MKILAHQKEQEGAVHFFTILPFLKGRLGFDKKNEKVNCTWNKTQSLLY